MAVRIPKAIPDAISEYSIVNGPCPSLRAHAAAFAVLLRCIVDALPRCPAPPRGRTHRQERSKRVDQMRNQRNIRRRHRIGTQPFRPHPRDPLAFAWPDLPFPPPAHIEWHQQVERGVSVTGESQRREAGRRHVDAELFLELANERLFGTLTR